MVPQHWCVTALNVQPQSSQGLHRLVVDDGLLDVVDCLLLLHMKRVARGMYDDGRELRTHQMLQSLEICMVVVVTTEMLQLGEPC